MLPGIRSHVVLSDCLGYLPRSSTFGYVSVRVRDFCAEAQLGKLICIDVGRYQLHGKYGKYQFINRRLSKMWSSVQSTPADYNACADLKSMMQSWQPQQNHHNALAWNLQTSLRCWVGMYDELVPLALSGALQDLRASDVPQEREKYELIRNYAATTRPLSFNDGKLFSAYDLVFGDTDEWESETLLLRGLKPGGDKDFLEWASEYLAKNIAGYTSLNPTLQGQIAPKERSHWSETDGCLDAVEVRTTILERARSGAPVDFYIRHPVDDTRLISTDRASQWILHTSEIQGLLHRNISFNHPIQPLQAKQLAYLSLALHDWDDAQAQGGEYLAQYESWAASLLRNYLLARGFGLWLDWHAVHNVSLAHLRKIITNALEHLDYSRGPQVDAYMKKHTSEADLHPPETVDSDLYKPLAWSQGKLFKYLWMESMAGDSGRFSVFGLGPGGEEKFANGERA